MSAAALLRDIVERAKTCEDASEFALWVQSLEPRVAALPPLVEPGQLSRAAASLRLDCAKLTGEDMRQADELYRSIYTTIETGMERRGVEIKTNVTDRNVIAEVNQRLRREKWSTQWQPIMGKFDKSTTTGWLLFLFPTDEAYVEAGDVSVRIDPAAH